MKNKFIEFIATKPGLTIIISLLMTFFIGSGVRFIIIDDDLMNMLPGNLASKQLYDEVMDDFGNSDVMFIAYGIEGENALNKKTLSICWDITEALENIEGVDEIVSISNTNAIESDDGFMAVGDLQPNRDLNDEELERIIGYLDANPDFKLRFLSDDGFYLNLIVRTLKEGDLNAITHEIDRIKETNLNDYDVHIGGQAYVTGIVPQLIMGDTQKLMLVGVILMVLILLANLRSHPAVGLVMVTILLSALGMMGFMGYMVKITGSPRFYFTLINSPMPIILLTIANSDGVHIITRFFRELRSHQESDTAIRRTLKGLMLPVFLTSLTTALAFVTLVSAPIMPVTGMGLSLAFGVIWAWVLSITFLPAVLGKKTWNLTSKAITHKSFFEKASASWGNILVKNPKLILSIGSLIVLVSIIGVFLVEVEVNILSFFKEGSDIRNSYAFLDDKMLGTMTTVFRFDGDIKDPKVLNDMETLQNHLEENPKVTMTISIADVIKQMHKSVMDDDPTYEVIPNTKEEVNNLFTLYGMSGDPDDFSSLVSYEYDQAIVTAMLKSVSTNEIITFANETDDFLRGHLSSGADVKSTGLLIILKDFVYLVINSAIYSLIASIILIGLLGAYFFKSYKWGGLAILPLTSAVLLNFGLMGLIGVQLSHITALLSSIIIGVGVDFAIHYIAEFRTLLKQGVTANKISAAVISEVGYPIFLDAASNMGFIALVISAFLPIQYIGGLMTFAMISTSIGTLTLLAASTELLKKKIYAFENIRLQIKGNQ
jgi:uncharacterized protein